MTNATITPKIEQAQTAVDAYGSELFPCFHASTRDYQYSLYDTVSREFDVAELMTGLGITVDPAYEFRPSPFVAASTRAHYEAAYAISTAGDWDGKDITDYPEVIAEFGERDTEQGICILMDSSAIADLLHDYFALERVSETNARAALAEYMRLLDKADKAYREAGWEL